MYIRVQMQMHDMEMHDMEKQDTKMLAVSPTAVTQ